MRLWRVFAHVTVKVRILIIMHNVKALFKKNFWGGKRAKNGPDRSEPSKNAALILYPIDRSGPLLRARRLRPVS